MEGGRGGKGKQSTTEEALVNRGWPCELGGVVGSRGEQWADGGGRMEPALGMDGMERREEWKQSRMNREAGGGWALLP